MGRFLHILGFWYLLIPYIVGIAIQSLFHQNYQTVTVSLISSVLLIIILIFQTYIYPKKKLSFLALLILLSLLPIISLFRLGTYESGDFNLHIYRIMSFYDSLREGNIMPSWAANINGTYGNPIFIFNYSLPYYIVSLFHFLGFSFVTSMKIMLGSTFVFSGIFMFLAMRKVANSGLAAFTAGIFYLFNPYHLVDFHFRATPGEMTLFMLAPLLLYFVVSYLKVRKIRYLYTVGLTTLLLSMAHPMVSITIHGLVLLFALTIGDVKSKAKSFLYLLLAITVGLIASLYIWLPFIIYLPVMYPPVSAIHPFSPFSELFYSPYRYGFLFQGPRGELTPTIGYVQELFVLLTIFLLFKNRLKKNTPALRMLVVIFFVLLFLMNPISNIVWGHFKMLWMLSDRLLLPTAVCTSLIGGYVSLVLIKKKAKILLYIAILIAIFSTILNWGHRRVITTMGDSTLVQYAPTATNFLEGPGVYFANTKWADKNHFWFDKIPKDHLEISNNQDFVHEIERTTTRHSYLVDVEKPTTFYENTLWYPGWGLTDHGKSVPIKPGERGVITGSLTHGLHYLVFEYKDISVYRNLKLLGLGIFLVLLSLLIGSFFGHPKYLTGKIKEPSSLKGKNKFKK